VNLAGGIHRMPCDWVGFHEGEFRAQSRRARRETQTKMYESRYTTTNANESKRKRGGQWPAGVRQNSSAKPSAPGNRCERHEH
jgi:hypothetical protein